jgi:hypothetical protein
MNGYKEIVELLMDSLDSDRQLNRGLDRVLNKELDRELDKELDRELDKDISSMTFDFAISNHYIGIYIYLYLSTSNFYLSI